MMEKYLEGEEPAEEELHAAIRRATIAGKLTPVLTRHGVQEQGRPAHARRGRAPTCPRPLDVGARSRATRSATRRSSSPASPSDDEPFAALAFKIMTDPHLGKLTYIRVYSGRPRGRHRRCSTRSRAARSASARSTGCTRTSARRSRAWAPATSSPSWVSRTPPPARRCATTSNPVVLESMTFPAPVIHVAIEPKTKSDQEKLGTAIQRLSDEDPTFQVRTDEETGQTIIAGMGELHLEVLVDRMRREFKVEANVGKPQVAYRETITKQRRARRLHAQEADRWLRPVREGADRHRAVVGHHRGRGRLRVRQRRHRWPHPARVHPLGRRRLPGGHGERRARRLPDGRHQGHPARTAPTTTSTPPSSRSRSPVRWRSRRRRARPAPCSSSR